MNRDIALSSPDLTDDDLNAVADVLRSGRLALGPKAEEFERRLADRTGARYGIAVSSGTAALHLIVKALGIGPGDEVLVPSFTFPTSVNVLFYEDAKPVFVDIDLETHNLCPVDVERKITKRTRAIMVVDVFGHPAEWDQILAIASRHGLRVIDDSCEALGAEYKGRPLGRFGDVAAFAFYPNKQITTGEGGMVVTDDYKIATLARSLRDQGRRESGGRVEYERLGYNYRMDEMSAALGLSQLGRLDATLRKREEVTRMYTERLRHLDWLTPPSVRDHVRVSWFAYVVTLAEAVDRNAIMAAMAEDGIPTRNYFPAVHSLPYVRERIGDATIHLPVTESVASRTMALPFHNGLTEAQIERVVEALWRAKDRAS